MKSELMDGSDLAQLHEAFAASTRNDPFAIHDSPVKPKVETLEGLIDLVDSPVPAEVAAEDAGAQGM